MKQLLFILLFLCQFCYGQDSTKIKQLFRQALDYEDKGDIANAIKTQTKLFNLDTRNYASANIIAGLYGKIGKFSEEIFWANKAIEISPKFSNGYINLGNGYAGQGNISKAENSFKEALELDSTSPYPYYSLGVIEETKKDFNSAVIYYEKSVSLNPKFENGYFNLAAAYATLKNFKKANENILKVLELNPNDKDAQEMHVHIIEELLK